MAKKSRSLRAKHGFVTVAAIAVGMTVIGVLVTGTDVVIGALGGLTGFVITQYGLVQ